VIQLRALFTKKFILILLSVLTSIALLQALRLHQYMQVYEVQGNIMDFLLFTIGGRENPTLFTFLLTWLSLSFLFLYVSARSRIVIENFSEFLVTRNRNRICAWISNCIAQLILSIILFTIYFLILIGIGAVGFDGSLTVSAYTREFYFDWALFLDIGFLRIVGIISLVFISGLYAIFTVEQVLLLICRNTMQALMSLAGIMMVGAISYIYMGAPRVLALTLYTSTVSLNAAGTDVLRAILMNIVLGGFFTILGGVCMRKRDMHY